MRNGLTPNEIRAVLTQIAVYCGIPVGVDCFRLRSVKEPSTPYVAHLLAVAATVLEYGGDEDLAIAALLHDSVEDQGGKARLMMSAIGLANAWRGSWKAAPIV